MLNRTNQSLSPFLLACLATSLTFSSAAVANATALEPENGSSSSPVALAPPNSAASEPPTLPAAPTTAVAIAAAPEPTKAKLISDPAPVAQAAPAPVKVIAVAEPEQSPTPPASVAAAPAEAAPTAIDAPSSLSPATVKPLKTSAVPPYPSEPTAASVPVKVRALATETRATAPAPPAPQLEPEAVAHMSHAVSLAAIAATQAQPATPSWPGVAMAATPIKQADLELAQVPLDPEEPPAAPPTTPEAQVLVAEVVVGGDPRVNEVVEFRGEPITLESLVYETIDTRPGQTTTRSQLQDDVNAIYATGYFADVSQVPEDTPLGVRITFQVEVNPVLSRVVVQNLPAGTETQALEQAKVDEIFGDGYGEILNLRELQLGIVELNDWYAERGFDLAQVLSSPEVSNDGVVTLLVAEGIVEDIRVRYIDEEDEFVDGRTRPFIITREMKLKPGDVFNRNIAQADLQRIFGLGIFEDVRLAFEPGSDPSQVIVNVDVLEANTGSIAAGAGISSASGLFGTASYQQQNVGGNNQTIAAEVGLGEREILFDLSFTDPWIGGDPYRTSYTVNMFRRRSISLIFDEGDPEVRLPNNDRPRVVRTGGGITFNRPLSRDVFSRAEWSVSAGFQYQGVALEDADGATTPRDSQDNLLSFTNGGRDTLVSLQFGAARDRRNSVLNPTSGSLLRFGTEQTLPIGSGQIVFNRLRANYSHYIPVDWLSFVKPDDETGEPAPQALAFNIQGGTIIGDLPPYEAFSLGGANSVRGYEEGDLGSGRSYLQASAEYRFPILSFLGGVLFLDYGTDLGTGDDVPGNPAGVRNKPGDGFGYGIGVRIQSPLGPIRVDYGINDEGDSRIHFGIGQRF